MKKDKLKFGDRGFWNKSKSDDSKSDRIPCVVLEDCGNGVLYLFLDRPIKKEFNNLINRTVTVLKKDFELK